MVMQRPTLNSQYSGAKDAMQYPTLNSRYDGTYYKVQRFSTQTIINSSFILCYYVILILCYIKRYEIKNKYINKVT